MSNKITIKLFGNLSELLQNKEVSINFKSTFFELKEELFLQYPILKNREFVFAIDQKLIHENVNINPNSEIALLPPFSGG